MPRFLAALLMLILSSNFCFASEGDDQANSSVNIYAALCFEESSKSSGSPGKAEALRKLAIAFEIAASSSALNYRSPRKFRRLAAVSILTGSAFFDSAWAYAPRNRA